MGIANEEKKALIFRYKTQISKHKKFAAHNITLIVNKIILDKKTKIETFD